MYDVIFVDDDKALADTWRDTIEEKLSLRVFSTNSAAEAFELASGEGFKVAILDQRMSEESGISLGKRLHSVDPSVRLVLMSGEASYTEGTEAQEAGFVTLHKNVAKQRLTSIITRLLMQYEIDLEKKLAPRPILIEGKRGFFERSYRITYRLLSVDQVDENYVFPNSWKTRARVDAGETKTEKLKISWSKATEVEFELNRKSSAELGLSSDKNKRLTAALKSEISRRIKDKVTLSTSLEAESERTVSLPVEPSNFNQLHIKSRSFQVAPVYVRVSANISSTCSCCGHTALRRIFATFPTSRYSTRHVDHMSDGSTHETVTGFEDVN